MIPAQPLTWEGDLSARMMDGAHRFVDRKIAEALAQRPKYWKRDFSSPEAYEKSVEPNRERFRRIIGVVDPRVPPRMEQIGDSVRWDVLDGVRGEGLIVRPRGHPIGYLVLLPDPDERVSEAAARRLARSGFEVYIPVLIDRTARWSGHPDIKMTDQPHREWIYRQAFHMGRHIIGYEVQKVLALVDWLHQEYPDARIGVAGLGEGGLIAFYSAAADTRIDAVLVSGYFNSRQNVWSEPIYHNVWGLLREFGDAELASLIAPRTLVVESSFDSAKAEFDRIDSLVPEGFQGRHFLQGGPWSTEALAAFAGQFAGETLEIAAASGGPIAPAFCRPAKAPGGRVGAACAVAGARFGSRAPEILPL